MKQKKIAVTTGADESESAAQRRPGAAQFGMFTTASSRPSAALFKPRNSPCRSGGYAVQREYASSRFYSSVVRSRWRTGRPARTEVGCWNRHAVEEVRPAAYAVTRGVVLFNASVAALLTGSPRPEEVVKMV
jgi:hypothetical protein